MKESCLGFSLGRVVLGLVLLAPMLPSEARADTVDGLRSELLVERSHAIELILHAGFAELVVKRTIHNGGGRHDQATFMIDLPEGAVATGLRTLGSLAGRPHWFAGELLEAEAAAEKYRELTGIGGYYPKDPALLSWRSQGQLALQVFPCPPRADKSIEYKLTLPTQYRDGAHHLTLPALGTDALSATIRARAAEPGARILVGGAPVPRLVRPEPGTDLDFALVTSGPPLLSGELVQSEFAPGRTLTRFATRAAPRLSEVPRGAYVALVVDRSLSTDSGFIQRAKVTLAAYLSHFEDARVELLLFDRKVERPFGGFVPVADARLALAALTVQRHNGSDVDFALAEADRLLAATKLGAPRRIVLVTDGLTRTSMTPERLRAATLKSGAVTHVGLLEPGSPHLQRDDEHPWANALRHNHGLVWRADASDDSDLETLTRVYEEWARPVRLHRFRMLAPELGLQTMLEAAPPELDEGQGLEELRLAERPASFLTVEGELWTERVSNTFAPDKAREKLWSALVFGSPLLYDLSEPEMMTLALQGGAVSPVTSYLAIEPGVRPSTEGLTHEGMGFGSGRLAGMRYASTSVSGRVPELDRQEFLQRMLADDWRRCGGRPGEANVTLETTSAEIVSIESDLGQNIDPLLGDCLREAVWDLVLPVQFEEEWNSWTVYL